MNNNSDTNNDEIKTEKLTEEEKLEQETIICLEWLLEQKITKTINKKRTSYVLKHCVEEWYKEHYGQHKYISNDAMIAAIIKLGIPFESIGPNVFAAVSIKHRKEERMAACLFKRSIM
jgi:hypothetical protein